MEKNNIVLSTFTVEVWNRWDDRSTNQTRMIDGASNKAVFSAETGEADKFEKIAMGIFILGNQSGFASVKNIRDLSNVISNKLARARQRVSCTTNTLLSADVDTGTHSINLEGIDQLKVKVIAHFTRG